MNYFDIIIIAPLLWGAYKGFKKGFIIEIASLIALFFGIYGGIKFSSISANYLGNLFNISVNLMPLISFAVTFIIIVIAIFSLAKLLQKIIKMVALGFINRLAGGIFGILKFGLILSVILNIVNTLNREIHFIDENIVKSSILFQPMANFSTKILPEIKKLDIHQMVEKAIEKAPDSK